MVMAYQLFFLVVFTLDPKHKKSKVEEFEKERRQEFMMSPGRANNLSLNMTWAYILLQGNPDSCKNNCVLILDVQ